jgi:hypothetical protein
MPATIIGPELAMAVMHRSMALGLEGCGRRDSQFLRHIGRALGGDGEAGQIGLGFLGQHAHGGDSGVAALRRPMPTVE